MEKLELAITTRRNVQSVSARELHEKLESPERFSKWWKRFSSYGFEENVDYVVCTKKTVANQHGGEKEFTDYAVSVDMAKQICMLQRNEKGMEYFFQNHEHSNDFFLTWKDATRKNRRLNTRKPAKNPQRQETALQEHYSVMDIQSSMNTSIPQGQ